MKRGSLGVHDLDRKRPAHPRYSSFMEGSAPQVSKERAGLQIDGNQAGIYEVVTRAPGPEGSLPLTDQMLREEPSGNLFGLTQNVGMGWDPTKLGGKQVLILSTQGGLRGEDGKPVALGYHTRGIGKLDCRCGLPRRLCGLRERSLFQRHVPTRATDARRERRECLIACRIAMTRRWCFADSSARCRAGRE